MRGSIEVRWSPRQVLRSRSVAAEGARNGRPGSIQDALSDGLFATMGNDRDRALLAFYVSSGARATELLELIGEHVGLGPGSASGWCQRAAVKFRWCLAHQKHSVIWRATSTPSALLVRRSGCGARYAVPRCPLTYLGDAAVCDSAGESAYWGTNWSSAERSPSPRRQRSGRVDTRFGVCPENPERSMSIPGAFGATPAMCSTKANWRAARQAAGTFSAPATRTSLIPRATAEEDIETVFQSDSERRAERAVRIRREQPSFVRYTRPAVPAEVG